MAAPAAWARPCMSTARLASYRSASPASNPGTAMSPKPTSCSHFGHRLFREDVYEILASVWMVEVQTEPD